MTGLFKFLIVHKKFLYRSLAALPLTFLILSIYVLPVHAVGTIITFSTLDDFFDSFIITIQHYALPVMTIVLIFLGIKLIASGDDTGSKDLIKSWMIKILIGGVIIFGASYLALAIKNALGAGNIQ